MNDREIVRLFWARSPQAIAALEETYGPQLKRLAGNILVSSLDAEECINDAYLGLWNSIPPANPHPLLPYVLRVVRNHCLKRYRWNVAQKRNSQFDLAFSEMESCLADSSRPEEAQDLRELQHTLEDFLWTLSKKDRALFLGRYWYACSHKELAVQLGMTENNVAVRLSRLRGKLLAYLKQKGVLE